MSNDNDKSVEQKPSEPVVKCQNCDMPGTPELHPCPYSEEINGDDTPKCNCCADCRHQCCMDI